MKRQWHALSRRYHVALQRHLRPGAKPDLQAAHRLGRQAVALGVETLDLAQMHKCALAGLIPPGGSISARDRMVKQAGHFFTETITRIEKAHRAGVESTTHLDRKSKALIRRTAQLAAAHRRLKQGIVQRKAAEEALKASEQHYAMLLAKSRELQRHLQKSTHRILSAQEDERRMISNDLRDEIAQTLLGINVRLLTLKKGATASTKSLAKEIASTQRLAEQSVRTIHRFARKFGGQHEA